MEIKERTLRLYLAQTSDVSPFEEWFSGLRDVLGKRKILLRLARVRVGNLGDCKSVGEGVKELRVDVGPGYRVYFGEEQEYLVILLMGGDKGTQERDIKRAKENWHDYQRRKKAKEY